MAKKKAPRMSRGRSRQLRVQRIIFIVISVIIVASFILSLIT